MRHISLDDRYRQERGDILLSGVQALVRLAVEQMRRDRAQGLHTGTYISGYRGSPLGGFDTELARANSFLEPLNIRVQPGVNEDLAATAVWGSQQVTSFPGASVDGVVGLWYGKAPGVDRSGDAFKHANMSGTSATGGVLAVAGDDPAAKSSAFPCTSEYAFVDAEMPVLAPADVQDLLDFGLYGIALSRFAGLWVGMTAAADSLDSTAVINVDPARLAISEPEDRFGRRHFGPHIVGLSKRHLAEQILREARLPAARAFLADNQLNRAVVAPADAHTAILACGALWSGLLATLETLGIDQADLETFGIRLVKIGALWPLPAAQTRALVDGVERVLVLENKRTLVEDQLKGLLYGMPAGRQPAIFGKTDVNGAPFVKTTGELGVSDIAVALRQLLPAQALSAGLDDRIGNLLARLRHGGETGPARLPYFCAGCPHNTSTKLPEGSRAIPGVGCHIMVDWMGRTEDPYTHMGGEGITWLGQAPFTATEHVYVNLGDGTYFHSGLLAIRQAVAAGVNMTYRLLYNDAVAMTGGQAVDGSLDVPTLTRQLAAEGVSKIVIASERPELYADRKLLAEGVDVVDRAETDRLQRDLAGLRGVSVLIYDQTCAAEKRRRRKRGTYAKSARKLMINERVCEGCGDCSVQSNCIAVEPKPTPFGIKRQINQAACNQDLSCAKGFCPSFVEIEGAAEASPPELPHALMSLAERLPAPVVSLGDAPVNCLLTGIGGTGITTASAVLAMAAHLDGIGVRSLDMTGLAQKGGAVTAHVRFAASRDALTSAKLSPASADLVMAVDLVVAAGDSSLGLMDDRRSHFIGNRQVGPTAAFTLLGAEGFTPDQLYHRLEASARKLELIDATELAEHYFGDALFAGMIVIGAAFQRGRLPVSKQAILQALALNGVATERNQAAFQLGRLAIARPDAVRPETAGADPASGSFDVRMQRFVDDLTAYQDKAYAERFRQQVARIRLREAELGIEHGALSEAVAASLYKLMAYKDEYEVARLYSDPAFIAELRDTFGDQARFSVLLAPPMLSGIDPNTGRPRKRRFGPWVFPLFRLLARGKSLRGTVLDPFGHTAERRAERRLILSFEALLARFERSLCPANYDIARELAALPQRINGYGPIKMQKIDEVAAREADLLTRFDALAGQGDDTWPLAAE